MTDDIHVVICDFGISQILSTSKKIVTTSSVKGSIPYMSPELFSGSSSSTLSDVWAWGCLVLCVGQPVLFVSQSLQLKSHRLRPGSILTPPLKPRIPSLDISRKGSNQPQLALFWLKFRTFCICLTHAGSLKLVEGWVWASASRFFPTLLVSKSQYWHLSPFFPCPHDTKDSTDSDRDRFPAVRLLSLVAPIVIYSHLLPRLQFFMVCLDIASIVTTSRSSKPLGMGAPGRSPLPNSRNLLKAHHRML